MRRFGGPELIAARDTGGRGIVGAVPPSARTFATVDRRAVAEAREDLADEHSPEPPVTQAGHISGFVFARDVEALAAAPGVELVVLDLRHNGGGDNRTYGPLLKSMERLGDATPIAVLTSRTTFSAAMQLVVDLEQSTPALFVGEPTGGSPLAR